MAKFKETFRILISDNPCSDYIGTDCTHYSGVLICPVEKVFTLDEFCQEYYDAIECKITEIKAKKLAKEIKVCCQYRDVLQGQVNSSNTDIKNMCDEYFNLTGKPYKSNE